MDTKGDPQGFSFLASVASVSLVFLLSIVLICP